MNANPSTIKFMLDWWVSTARLRRSQTWQPQAGWVTPVCERCRATSDGRLSLFTPCRLRPQQSNGCDRSRATAATHRLDLCPSAWRSCLCASRAWTRLRASSSRRKPSCKWPEVSREDKQTNALTTTHRHKVFYMAAILYNAEDRNTPFTRQLQPFVGT